MNMWKVARIGALAAGSKFDGSWLTKLACEAHGETPAYKWEFASEIKDGNFHGQHGEADGPGYLVIEGKIGDDGNAKPRRRGRYRITMRMAFLR